MFSYIYIYFSLFNFPCFVNFPYSKLFNIYECLKQDLGLGFETGFWAQNLGIGKDGNSASAVYKKIAKPYRVGVRVVAGFK